MDIQILDGNIDWYYTPNGVVVELVMEIDKLVCYTPYRDFQTILDLLMSGV